MILRLEVAGRKRNSQPGCESRIHLLPDMSFETPDSGNHTGNQLSPDETETVFVHLLGYQSPLDL
jgi:hypothetical protein